MQLTHLLVILGVLSFCRSDKKCTSPSPYFSCRGTVVIIIDGTHHMQSHGQIKKEISYIENVVVPRLGIAKEFKVAFMLSGVGDNYEARTKYACSHKEACSELESMQCIADKKGLQKENLRKILDHMYWNYDHGHAVILFSRSEDEDEISEAAEYARKYLTRDEITVVALSGNVHPWKRFPAVSVYAVDVTALDDSNHLDYCIAERSCILTGQCKRFLRQNYFDGVMIFSEISLI
ncbi:hypothetical protein RB195_009858 [Necator americanus]|uniref:VWFA domain-containing protein n=1 Tax=Necator americanus TaxID=51031 RepID=A0ABR1CV83_NECAM